MLVMLLLLLLLRLLLLRLENQLLRINRKIMWNHTIVLNAALTILQWIL